MAPGNQEPVAVDQGQVDGIDDALAIGVAAGRPVIQLQLTAAGRCSCDDGKDGRVLNGDRGGRYGEGVGQGGEIDRDLVGQHLGQAGQRTAQVGLEGRAVTLAQHPLGEEKSDQFTLGNTAKSQVIIGPIVMVAVAPGVERQRGAELVAEEGQVCAGRCGG